MSEQPDNLVLTMLRSIHEEQAAQREKLDEIISRIGTFEREVATSNLRIAEIRVDFASLSVRIDNLSPAWSYRAPPRAC